MPSYIQETHSLAFELGQIAHLADPTSKEEAARIKESAKRFQRLVTHFSRCPANAPDVEDEIQEMIQIGLATGRPKKKRCDQTDAQRFSTLSTILAFAAGKAEGQL
jgi:hypothetical protein